MRRKLIAQGKGGLTLYLPKKWTDQKKLSSGQEIEIIEAREGLIIKAEIGKEKKKEISVEGKGYSKRFLHYMLNNYYRAGYDVVKLGKDVLVKDVEEGLNLLMGFEANFDSKGEMNIESMTDLDYSKFDSILRNLFYLVINDLEEVGKEITNGGKIGFEINLEEISIKSNRAIKYSNSCLRILIKERNIKTGFLWTLVNLITWIHRQIYYMLKNLPAGKEVKINKEIKDYIISVSGRLRELHDGIYKQNFEMIEKVHKGYRKSETKRFELMAGMNKEEAIIMHYYNIINEMILRATSSAMGMMIIE